jgi:hypothetical protein
MLISKHAFVCRTNERSNLKVIEQTERIQVENVKQLPSNRSPPDRVLRKIQNPESIAA